MSHWLTHRQDLYAMLDADLAGIKFAHSTHEIADYTGDLDADVATWAGARDLAVARLDAAVTRAIYIVDRRGKTLVTIVRPSAKEAA